MQTRMLGTPMLDRGFSRGFAASVLAWGSLMTPIVSPGIGFILYGTVGQVSIGRLFASGIVPALLLWAAMALTVSITARRLGYQAERALRPSLGEAGRALWGGVWAILFPVFLLLGLRFGIFTPSEIGALAVAYAVIVGWFAYRQLRRSDIREALEGSLVDIGAVMLLLALSAIFGYGIVFDRAPEAVSVAMLQLSADPNLLLLVIVAAILIGGYFIDGAVLIIMLTPIFLPLVLDLGVDEVHFGLVFVLAATVGNFTPPVGAGMFAVCSILKCPVGDYTRASLPFALAVALVLAALIFVPGIALMLPNLLFGKNF